MTGSAGAAPSAYLRRLRRWERSAALDPVVDALDPLAGRLVAGPRRRALLHGEATAIPPHVILTDVPFGAWFMAQYLDLFADAGTRRAAQRLVGLGVVAAVPTMLTGWAEWALADRGTRRLGVVHAAANSVALVVFAGSWAARRDDRHRTGVVLARVGGGVLVCGGFLGGYLRSARPPVDA